MVELHPEHLADLRRSGLSDDTIVIGGLHSVRPCDIGRITALAGVTSLLAIPYHQGFTRYKVFPTTLKDSKGKGLRYLQPKSSGTHLYIPPAAKAILQDASVPLAMTEGEKKALKACQEGIMCVAIGGLWNWLEGRRRLHDFEEIALPGRQVTLYPDSDVWGRKDL